MHWWEFDIGWWYIRIFNLFGLASIKKVAPRPTQNKNKQALDLEAVRAIVSSRLHIMAKYTKHVTYPVLKTEMLHADRRYRLALKRVRKALVRERSRMTSLQLENLNSVLIENRQLKMFMNINNV